MIENFSEGEKRWRLTMIERLPRESGKNRKGRFICECGNETVAVISRVKSGLTKSCGCLSREVSVRLRTKHGQHGSETYGTWCAMLSRCENPSNVNYKNYGGRGITVCDRWHEFSEFFADMGERPRGMTIDRIDNNLGYFPGTVDGPRSLIRPRIRGKGVAAHQIAKGLALPSMVVGRRTFQSMGKEPLLDVSTPRKRRRPLIN